MNRDQVLQATTRFLARRPAELGRALRSLVGLRLGFPLELFRWLGEQAEAHGPAENVTLHAVPPGLAVGATVPLMGTRVRVLGNVYVERVQMGEDELRIELRLEHLRLRLEEDSDSPVATLIKSGVLDLSKPGNLVKHLPRRPAILASADDNRIVLDMMQHPELQDRRHLKRAIALATAFLTVHGVETDEGHVDVRLRALPGGVFHAAKQVRRHLLQPGIRRARQLLPGFG